MCIIVGFWLYSVIASGIQQYISIYSINIINVEVREAMGNINNFDLGIKEEMKKK